MDFLGVPQLVKTGDEEVSVEKFKERSKVPITILTGFLGSGKTTLLQHILRVNHGLKVAVLMNEFAETGEIEKTITSQKAGKVADEWVEFNNGCLCCSAKDSAMIALEALLRKRSDIDHIVIETSGMANPGPIIQKLWVDEALDCLAELDGVVCLVDALRAPDRLSPGSPQYAKEASVQIALADMVIVNKQDLVDNKRMEELTQMVKSINPFCLLQHSIYSDVRLERLLNLGEYRSAQGYTRDPAEMLLSLDISTFGHSASSSMRSFSLDIPLCVELASFERWLFTLLWERTIHDNILLEPSTDIMRIKGLLYATNSLGKRNIYALQAVEQMYELTPIDLTKNELRCCIVFIGLISTRDEQHIRSSFSKLLNR